MNKLVFPSAKNSSIFKITCLSLVILSGIVFFCLNATRHGLWSDEAVEYYFSKYISGTVPGGYGTTNMYERILITYQPPLYNILMHFWLAVFDTEFTFRLAGILVTLIGAVGVFFSIDLMLPEGIWNSLGTLLYLFSYGTVYYALECAEYNLMMCFSAWTVYFFICFLIKKDTKSIIGFFALSCLAVYSQYGASFIILGMAVALLLNLILTKDYRQLKKFLLAGILSATCAILPLICFFALHQMKNMENSATTHKLFFERGFITELTVGAKDTLEAMFGDFTVYGVLILLGIFLVSLFFNPRKLFYPFLAVIISWICYFFAVCSSFYGVKIWEKDSVGSINLGNRYSFFFIPMLVIILTISLGLLTNKIKTKYKAVATMTVFACTICCLLSCSYEINRTVTNDQHKIGDDVRELVSVWYDHELYNSDTLIFQWDDALFNYYLTHDNRYQESYSSSIESTDLWITTADYNEMQTMLSDMGYLSVDDFYFVTSSTKDNPAFISVMKDAGYEVDEILFSGESILVHIKMI